MFEFPHPSGSNRRRATVNTQAYSESDNSETDESSTEEEEFIENDEISSEEESDTEINLTELFSVNIAADLAEASIAIEKQVLEEEDYYSIFVNLSQAIDIGPRSKYIVPLLTMGAFPELDTNAKYKFFPNSLCCCTKKIDRKLHPLVSANLSENKLSLSIHNNTDFYITVDRNYFLGEVEVFTPDKNAEFYSFDFCNINGQLTELLHQEYDATHPTTTNPITPNEEIVKEELDLELQKLICDNSYR
jgi:hypothetical protein